MLLGYTESQIQTILAGKKSIQQLTNEQKRKIAGYYRSQKKSHTTPQQKKINHSSDNPTYTKGLKPNTINLAYQQTYVQEPIQPQKDDNTHPIQSFSIYGKAKAVSKKLPFSFYSFEPKDYGINNRLMNKVKPLWHIIKDASAENNINPSLILALIKVESGFNDRAVSPKGAMGLMQLMPITAKTLGVTNPFDPIQNIHGGTRYLSHCLQSLKNKSLAVAAYNAGINRVSQLTKIPPYRETQNFVKNVLKYEKLFDQLLQELFM